MSKESTRALVWSIVALLLVILLVALSVLVWLGVERRQRERAELWQEMRRVEERRRNVRDAVAGDRRAFEKLLERGDNEDLQQVLPSAILAGHRYTEEELESWLVACGVEALPLVVQQLQDARTDEMLGGFPSAALRLREQLDPDWSSTFEMLCEQDIPSYRSLILQEADQLAVAGGRLQVLAWLASLLRDTGSTHTSFTRLLEDGSTSTYQERVADRALSRMADLLAGQQPWELPSQEELYHADAWNRACAEAIAWWEAEGATLDLQPRGWLHLHVRGLPRDADGEGQVAVLVEGTGLWSSTNQPPEAEEARLLLGPYLPGDYTLRVCDARQGTHPNMPGVEAQARVEAELCTDLDVNYEAP